MMHGREKSDLAIVAMKHGEQSGAIRRGVGGAKGGDQGECEPAKAPSGRRAGQTCHRRWSAYGKHLPSHTQGGSRMRESRTYGSVRGARDETRVPTATEAHVHHDVACLKGGARLILRAGDRRRQPSGGPWRRLSYRRPPALHSHRRPFCRGRSLRVTQSSLVRVSETSAGRRAENLSAPRADEVIE